MAIDYEKICDEWMVYISTLDLESRKAKFKEYLEASGVYDLDSSTIFYLSEYNNFLTEGITTLLHDKAQQAKKSGKGLAHYRHTSFALSKPDAMNIVHEYIHKKVLLHTEMVNNNLTKMPNTFPWSFLFNIPEYVNNEKLLTDKEIPSLPHAKHTPKSVMTSELEETLNTQVDDEEEYSSDPFDIDVDDKQQSIDKQQIIEQLKHTLISKPLKEYSPDPYDIDENIQQYTPEPDALLSNEPITFAGIKHGSVQINGHSMSATTIIGGGGSGGGVGARTGHEGSASVAKLQQLQGSTYLDSWSKNKSKLVANAKKSTESESKSDYKTERERETIVIKRKVDLNESELEQEQREHGDETPNHRKAGSTIQGGYWKSQTSEKLVHLLNDAQEHRDEIVNNMQSMNENILNVVKMQQKQDMMDDMKTFLEQQNSAIIKVIKEANAANDGEMEANNERTLGFEQKMDANNKKYEAKILDLENRLKAFENEVKMKNNLISQQALNLKEFEMNVNNNKDMQQIKIEIMKEMQSEFETFNAKKNHEAKEKEKKSVFSNEKIMDIVDKTDEILTKLSAISKYQQQLKQQYTFINEGIDGVNDSNEKYYNQTVRKMNDFNHKMSENINDIRIDQKTNNNNHSHASNNNNNIVVTEMVKVTNLASQLTQDMGAASMLSVMRNEYNNVRKEKEEMRGEVERYRRENEMLSLRKQELEEEAINVRESKRRTIKNLVDEINEMRDQIFRLSKRNQLK